MKEIVMSKPLSWIIDDYPKLRIEYPWMKGAIERLEKEIERLESEIVKIKTPTGDSKC